MAMIPSDALNPSRSFPYRVPFPGKRTVYRFGEMYRVPFPG
jgi:hypothetical protein